MGPRLVIQESIGEVLGRVRLMSTRKARKGRE